MMQNQAIVSEHSKQFSPYLAVDNDEIVLFVNEPQEQLAVEFLADVTAVTAAVAGGEKLQLIVTKERFEAYNELYLELSQSGSISIEVR
jgi:hypothetical protein